MKTENILVPPSPSSREEVFEELLHGGEFRLERIISTGQATPEGQWCDQDADEWVLLLSGRAGLLMEGQSQPCELRPGDAVHIPAHRRHRVAWTAPAEATVWLALHYRPHV
jgi:cupin 2 domain-containing protein